ncbi:MAG: OmpA family protein [Alphaproteobacteria bacterium]|nr:OmpA family protein [Alphaproteobacteria bacterium]
MMNIRFRNQTNAWPGFVDLFSNLVIILIFLLIVFVFLWTTTSVFNKTTGAKTVAELKAANAEQAQTIQQMAADEQEAKQLLILARAELENLENNNTEMANELNEIDDSITDLITAYENKVIQLQSQGNDMQTMIASLTQQLNQANLDKEKTAELEQERKKLQDDMALQRAELSDQLAKLQAALDASEEKSRKQEIQYVEMSTRLNKALADKVAELNDVSKYQSEFYKAIKLAVGDRTTVQPDGDRFIVNSDILFSSGSYTLSPEGKKQLRLIANVIKDMENKIPSDINWIIRVDGHTDKKAVIAGTQGYKNNTELSLLRATAVANELANAGVSKRRLVPSGFGDMHPVELGNDPATLQKNRRIELQLTNR